MYTNFKCAAAFGFETAAAKRCERGMDSKKTSFRQKSHEVKALEVYVFEQLEKLPKIETVLNDQQSYGICGQHHTICSDLLRQVLLHVGSFNTRLSSIIGNIWDVSSMNTLVLLKLCQHQLHQTSQLAAELETAKHVAEDAHVNTLGKINSVEREAKHNKVLMRDIQSENFLLSKQNERLVDENELLRHLLETMLRHSKSDVNPDLDISDEVDNGYVKAHFEDITSYRTVNPFSEASSNLTAILDSLVLQNQTQQKKLNDMDRFMKSNLVSVLWKYESQGKSTTDQFLEKLMSQKTKYTQTENILASSGSLRTRMNRRTSSQITPCIQQQLELKQRVTNLIPKDALVVLILQLWIEKVEFDVAALKEMKPRVKMGIFLTQSFKSKYGLESVGEARVADMLKSCEYYIEQLPRPVDPTGLTLEWNNARIFLFAQMCDILNDFQLDPVVLNDGLDAFIDVFADLLEVDPDIQELEQVLQRPMSCVALNRLTATTVVLGHFDYLDLLAQEDLLASFREAPPPPIGKDPKFIDLDWILSKFLVTWIRANEALTTRVQEAFRETICRRPNAGVQLQTTLSLTANEFIATVLDLDDGGRFEAEDVGELLFSIMNKKKTAAKSTDRRKSSMVLTTAPKRDEKQVTETEFLTHVSAFFRSKRPKIGIRTHGKPICDVASGTLIGGQGKVLMAGYDMKFKPGLRRSTAALIVPPTLSDPN